MATTSAHEYLTQSETLARYKDKLAGCLIGMAIGDALGATMEGEDAPNVAQFVQQANYEQVLQDTLYTDDTQLANCLIQPVLELGKFDVQRVVQVLAAMGNAKPILSGMRTGPGVFRHTGTNAKASIGRARKGLQWTEMGEPSAGNGASMRIGPLAAYCTLLMEKQLISEQQFLEIVLQSAFMTHRDPRGINTAVALAAGVSYFVTNGKTEEFSANKFMNHVATYTSMAEAIIQVNDTYKSMVLLPVKDEKNWSKKVHKKKHQPEDNADHTVLHVTSKVVKKLPAHMSSFSLEDSANRNAEYVQKQVSTTTPVKAAGGFALCSVMVSLLGAVQFDSYLEGITNVIALGDDCDSTGAMTGALLGAALGLKGIPPALVKALCNSDKLLARANAMAQIALNNGQVDAPIDGVQLQDLIDMESAPDFAK